MGQIIKSRLYMIYIDDKCRKGQGKKVVCIPAPAAINSRSSGEVVPSDLWAWRKYGQKPIKGSPYPRYIYIYIYNIYIFMYLSLSIYIAIINLCP